MTIFEQERNFPAVQNSGTYRPYLSVSKTFSKDDVKLTAEDKNCAVFFRDTV